MITVQEAELIIEKSVKLFSPISRSLQDAFGFILQEDIFADRDLPPFHRVAMDGIAINFVSWEKGNRSFTIEGVQKAGSPQLTLKDENVCLEAMTGAMLPQGCDCVIPVENIEVKEETAHLREGFKLTFMQNVHQQGSDYKQDDILLSKGCRLLSPQVAVAASVGKSKVQVAYAPKIAIISTGDELVEVDQVVESYQIRQSNSYVLQSALELQGYKQAKRFHIQDDKKILLERLDKILAEFDVVVLSGGVSMGKFDYVPQVLKALGVEVLFHKVKQRPGKPFWFGKTSEGKPVFALPGNPVATQIGVYRYVIPYLAKASGMRSVCGQCVELTEDMTIKTPFTYFLPVKIKCNADAKLTAMPVPTQGSGDYASLAKTDGFVELPADTFKFSKGLVVPFYPW